MSVIGLPLPYLLPAHSFILSVHSYELMQLRNENTLGVPEELDSTSTVQRQLLGLVRQRLQVRMISMRNKTISGMYFMQTVKLKYAYTNIVYLHHVS